jgi:septal ring factor EnvC (AmiA/AmiB activator)
MSSPWDEVRRESIEMPVVGFPQRARPSPLPWMLLTVSIAMTIGVLALGRNRLEEERLRTATALKANDDVKTQLKTAKEELDKGRAATTQVEASTSELQKQILTLELTNRRLQDELTRLKNAPKAGKK